jgi:hypothetical protein
MNKFVIGIVLLVVVVGLFWLFKPGTTQKTADPVSSAIASGAARVYKWKDAEGGWHITDTAPAPGIEFEIREYRAVATSP